MEEQVRTGLHGHIQVGVKLFCFNGNDYVSVATHSRSGYIHERMDRSSITEIKFSDNRQFAAGPGTFR
jgi:hypothetical protein